jgi:hypothetical protein
MITEFPSLSTDGGRSRCLDLARSALAWLAVSPIINMTAALFIGAHASSASLDANER